MLLLHWLVPRDNMLDIIVLHLGENDLGTRSGLQLIWKAQWNIGQVSQHGGL